MMESMKIRDDMLRSGIEVRERLERFVARRVDDPDDAEDIVQDVFLRLQEHRGRIDRSGRVVPWLFRVARNAIADHYRGRSRRHEVESAAEDDPAFDTVDPREILQFGHDSGQAHRELAECIRPMLDGLPERYREALDLVDLGGRSQRTAADEVGLSRSGMKSRVQRGRRMLQDRLLECCRVALSAAGTVMDYEAREDGACSRSGRSNGQATPGEIGRAHV